jgi:PAS domain S-box-containing protein
MLEANPALLHRVGLSLEQMQQRSFLDFFAGENLEELKHAFTALVMHGREVRGLEVRAKTAQGEIFTYEVNATPVQEQGQVTTILSVARDVTDRKRAEESSGSTRKLSITFMMRSSRQTWRVPSRRGTKGQSGCTSIPRKR